MTRPKEIDDIITALGSDLPPDVLEKMLTEAKVVNEILTSRPSDAFLHTAFSEIGCYVSDVVSYLELDKQEAFKDKSRGEVFRHILYSVAQWMVSSPETWWTYVEERAPSAVATAVEGLAADMGETDGDAN